MSKSSDSYALELSDVSMSFGPVRALANVSFGIRQGEIHGLVGANGSGKSTLVKILSGFHTPDQGTVKIWGNSVALPVRSAERHGMAIVHQDLALVEQMSVLENMIASTGFGTRALRPIRWAAQRASTTELLGRLDIDVDPATSVAEVGRGQRTLVAVARAIRELGETRQSAHFVVTDEPTSALSTSEAGALWDLLRKVRDESGAAMFISHHLREVLQVCDRVTVLRDGQVVMTAPCAGLVEEDLVRAMVGVELVAAAAPDAGSQSPIDRGGSPRLEVRGLNGAGLDNVGFTVHPGEVLGITGLLGMGHEVLPALVAGLRLDVDGTLVVDSQELDLGSPGRCRAAGIALVPADRHRDGLWMEGTVAENLGIVRSQELRRWGIYRRRKERAQAADLVGRFKIRTRDVETAVRNLSGGNQQKVLLAKWLQIDPKVVIMHEPTQGVDVVSKLEIHKIIRDFASARGAAVCIVSSDQDEVSEHCDRVLVMAHGRIVGEELRGHLTAERFMSLASAAR